ncbi:hypothetical protein Dalu01_03279 [Deinococcus aluminii]|uniref:Oligosaccharide repeat unit polymerase n=2 Tax=Deinococcus aluminii TaxID=1656885 RepID=A0ABP9XHM0_9DEIO
MSFNLNSGSPSWRQFLVIYFPIISSLLFILPISKIKFRPLNFYAPDFVTRLFACISILLSMLIFFSILTLSSSFGGIGNFLNLITSGGIFTIYIQNNLSKFPIIVQLGLFCWVFIPAIIALIYMDAVIKNRNKLLIFLSILISFIALLSVSWLLSARIIFIYALFSLIISRIIVSSRRSISKKEFYFMASGLALLILYLLVGQIYNKGNSTLNTNSGSQILFNYYSRSLENGSHIINSMEEPRNEAYWTSRTFLNMPLVGKRVQEFYKYYIDNIPINNRRDDFSYARALGVDPTYNTFSMPGYMYLDYGIWSVLVLSIFWILFIILYKASISISPYFSAIYSVMIITTLDYTRTATVFSDYGVYSFVVFALYYLLTNWRPHHA